MDELHQILIGELLLDSMLTAHPVKFQRVTGWHGVPSSRGRQDPIPGAHGSYPATSVLRSSLLITIRGYVRTATRAEAVAVIDEMSNLLAEGSLHQMRVSEADGWWLREVEVNDFAPEDPGGTGFARFTIDLTAPDPVRYRDPVTFGPVGVPVRSGGLRLPKRFPWNFGTSIRQIAQVVNDGTRPTYPVVTVQGAADSIVIHGGPRRIEYGAFSGTLVVDNRQRRAYLNGVDVTRQLVRRDWQAVPAGASWDFFFEAVNPDPDTVLSGNYQIGAW